MVSMDHFILQLGFLKSNLHGVEFSCFSVEFYECWQTHVLCNHHIQYIEHFQSVLKFPRALCSQPHSPTQALAITDLIL